MRKDIPDVPDGDKKIKMMILHREKAVKIEKSNNLSPFFKPIFTPGLNWRLILQACWSYSHFRCEKERHLHQAKSEA